MKSTGSRIVKQQSSSLGSSTTVRRRGDRLARWDTGGRRPRHPEIRGWVAARPFQAADPGRWSGQWDRGWVFLRRYPKIPFPGRRHRSSRTPAGCRSPCSRSIRQERRGPELRNRPTPSAVAPEFSHPPHEAPRQPQRSRTSPPHRLARSDAPHGHSPRRPSLRNETHPPLRCGNGSPPQPPHRSTRPLSATPA